MEYQENNFRNVQTSGEAKSWILVAPLAMFHVTGCSANLFLMLFSRSCHQRLISNRFLLVDAFVIIIIYYISRES